jgi:alkylated DNA repair dioxygenase AlkB
MRLATSEGPGCVDYRRGWVADHQTLFNLLRDEISWEQQEITLFGRTVPTPRLTSWMGDSAYRYSGLVNEPAPWPAALAAHRDRLNQSLGVGFNSCLANLYRDGSDSMGFHSDDEPELGPEPTIASISLGARRRFVLRHRVSRQRWSWDLGQGDLLVMRDESQREYRHAVPKTTRPIGPRMNLTFREFHPGNSHAT